MVTALWLFPRSLIIWKTQTLESLRVKNCEQIFLFLPFSKGIGSQLSHFILCKNIIGPAFFKGSQSQIKSKLRGFLRIQYSLRSISSVKTRIGLKLAQQQKRAFISSGFWPYLRKKQENVMPCQKVTISKPDFSVRNCSCKTQQITRNFIRGVKSSARQSTTWHANRAHSADTSAEPCMIPNTHPLAAQGTYTKPRWSNAAAATLTCRHPMKFSALRGSSQASCHPSISFFLHKYRVNQYV